MYNTYMENDEQRILAAKKVFKAVHTTSVNKLEKMITENPKHKDIGVIAVFAYFNSKTKINPLKHPNLTKLAKDFKEAVTKASLKDPFYNMYVRMEASLEYKRGTMEFKREVSKVIKEVLTESNTSIRALAEVAEVKYSNLYNFIENEKYSELSPKAVKKIWFKAATLNEGWETKYEVLSGMLKRFEVLQEYLEEEIEKGDEHE